MNIRIAIAIAVVLLLVYLLVLRGPPADDPSRIGKVRVLSRSPSSLKGNEALRVSDIIVRDADRINIAAMYGSAFSSHQTITNAELKVINPSLPNVDMLPLGPGTVNDTNTSNFSMMQMKQADRDYWYDVVLRNGNAKTVEVHFPAAIDPGTKIQVFTVGGVKVREWTLPVNGEYYYGYNI